MNKEFEKQYRNYIAEQVPDMWDRIEAGLKEKKPAESRMMAQIPADRENGGHTKRRQSVFGKGRTAAVLVPAAAVFLCVLVFEIFMKNNRKSDNMTADYEMAYEENGFAQNSLPAGGAENAGMSGGADGAGMAEDAAGGNAWEGVAAEAVEEGEGSKGKDGVAGIADDANTEDYVAAEENGAETELFLQVKVKIVEVMEAAEGKYDAVYLAKILEVMEKAETPVSEQVSEGREIYFYIGGDTDKTEGEIPKAGEEYEVLLQPVPGEENFFAKKINFIP